jgi:hypothetical protein
MLKSDRQYRRALDASAVPASGLDLASNAIDEFHQ